MTPRKHPPKLVLGPLTGRIYIATRYRERENGIIETQEKYDVTDDFMNLYAEATSKVRLYAGEPRRAAVTLSSDQQHELMLEVEQLRQKNEHLNEYAGECEVKADRLRAERDALKRERDVALKYRGEWHHEANNQSARCEQAIDALREITEY